MTDAERAALVERMAEALAGGEDAWRRASLYQRTLIRHQARAALTVAGGGE